MLAIILSPLYILANLYLFWRIFGWIRVWFPSFEKKRRWLIPVIIYAFFALSFLVAFFLPAGQLRRWMKLIGNYWLGVLLYMLLAVALADLLRLLFVHLLHLRERVCRPWVHRTVGGLCAAAILVVTVLGVVNAGNIQVTPYTVTVDKRAGDMHEMQVVLLADLHLGYNIGLRQMQQMVEKVNAQQPDLVVIAGDIFDNEWEAVDRPEQLAATLRGIRSTYGVYACYGNHDIEEPILAGFTFGGGREKASSPEMDAFLTEAGIQLLQDEAVLINGQVWLYGRPDAKKPGRGIATRRTPQQITEQLGTDKPILVLDHEPSELAELADAGVDVDLCGHTHDGQLFPGNLTIQLFWENAYGYSRKDAMQVIVTSGVGLFGPNMRVGTKAEICPITLRFAG